jgi:hypothetical protein
MGSEQKPKFNLDHDFFIIFDRFNGDDIYVGETEIADLAEDKAFEQLKCCDDPLAVGKVNFKEGTSSDASEDFARRWFDEISDNLVFVDDNLLEGIPKFIIDHFAGLEDVLEEMAKDQSEYFRSPEDYYGVPARI